MEEGGVDMIANCPVQRCAQRVLRTGKDFARAMRALRRAQRRCRKCEAEAECPIRARFHEEVIAAILAVQAEMHLVGGREERTECANGVGGRTTNGGL